MPQNKQMKIQWITVNGRQVPLVLPQVWNEGKQEWVISSEQNPLPVKAELTGSNVEDLLKKGKVIDTITCQRSGELAGGGSSEILVDLPNVNCELQSFSLGTNYHNIQIRISFYKEDGTLDGHLMIARKDGSGLTHPTPLRIHEDSSGENDFWKLQHYDESKNEYVLTMKRPLKCLNGVRITILNYAETSYNVAVNAAIAKWEV